MSVSPDLSPNPPAAPRHPSAPDASPCHRVRRALDAMRTGRPVVLFDDDDREDEADLIVAAQCLPEDVADRLDLPPMTARNGSRHGTAFTVSIEAREGVSTGVSAADRLRTVRAAIRADAQPGDLARPGHVFPLRARSGGVLVRRGHTEGSVDLARMAGLQPAAVLCELMNPDGTMMRRAEALAYAERHGLPDLTIEELAACRTLAGGDRIDG